MSDSHTAFYRGNTKVSLDFSAEEISSDGSLILLEKLERDHKLIKYFSKFLPDKRHPRLISYSREAQLKQRVYMMMLGYQDANDVTHLQHDPLFKDVLEGDLASQPTISQFENSLDKRAIFRLCHAWIDRYVSSLAGRKHLVIDVDSTDDPTHGNQQLSMFNGYYGQFMLNELFFHDGLTGQASNAILKKKASRAVKAVKYLNQGQKHQHFIRFSYQTKSWHKAQQCYAKVESTGLGMNIRYFVSHMKEKEAREIYFGCHLIRGEAGENRIKEVKNMCFSDRLFNHGYWANFFRLFISSLAYEMFLLIKQKIKKTSVTAVKKWQVSSIKTYLLKVGATIKITKKGYFLSCLKHLYSRIYFERYSHNKGFFL